MLTLTRRWWYIMSVLSNLLEEFKASNDLVEILFKYLKSIKYYSVLLSPKSTQKPGAVSNRWKVDVNIKLESDKQKS